MAMQDLQSIAKALVVEGKGILAADESTGTIKKRLNSVGVESTEENRRSYRDLLFTTQGAADYISGVILYDETIRQSTKEGVPFPEVLSKQGTIPGIKVDKGAKPMAGFPGERVTEGLDGLRERFAEYVKLGAKFSKWRAVITIGDGIPTVACMNANAHALVRYAALSQEAGLVPILEPEVLMDGDHDIDRCEQVTLETLNRLYDAIFEMGLELEGTLLKPNMVISGKECKKQASPEEIAEATVRTLLRAVPAAVPGIVFLSGGQTAEQATENLNAMNAMGKFPWELSFSYGRALQAPALKAWSGKADNVPEAQKVYHHRAKMNGAARLGKYTPKMEKELAA